MVQFYWSAAYAWVLHQRAIGRTLRAIAGESICFGLSVAPLLVQRFVPCYEPARLRAYVNALLDGVHRERSRECIPLYQRIGNCGYPSVLLRFCDRLAVVVFDPDFDWQHWILGRTIFGETVRLRITPQV